MPVPIGNFISNAVYDRRLKSSHNIRSLSSVSFVDVQHGKEERAGTSWTVSVFENMILDMMHKT